MEAEREKICPHCRSLNTYIAKICIQCGKDLKYIAYQIVRCTSGWALEHKGEIKVSGLELEKALDVARIMNGYGDL